MASRAWASSTWADGRVARLRHLLLLPQWAGPRLLEPGEACVLQFGQRQRGPRRLDSGAGLVDALLDLVAGQLQRFLSLGPVGLGGGERPPGDLDLDRHLLADPVQVGTLAGQLGLGRVELGPRHVDLVAVRDRVDLRHTCPCSTRSFSSTRNRTIRPETSCGATLTMWASTKASSVIECVRR